MGLFRVSKEISYLNFVHLQKQGREQCPCLVYINSVSSVSCKRRNETRMIYAVIFFVIFCKKRFKRYDMHIIVSLAQFPKAIRWSVYRTENIFIFVKLSVLGCAAFDIFPELLRQFSSGCCIIIRIYPSLFYADKIKCYIADFDILIT